MFDSSSLVAYLTLNVVVAAIPGPSMLYTVTRSLEGGTRAGFFAVFGLALGTSPHAVAVAAGVAAVLSSSPLAFEALNNVGVAMAFSASGKGWS